MDVHLSSEFLRVRMGAIHNPFLPSGLDKKSAASRRLDSLGDDFGATIKRLPYLLCPLSVLIVSVVV